MTQNTLHLPQTKFPMKAKLSEREPALIQHWKEKNIYQKMMEKRKNAPFFSFIDGPPYANGHLHIGHALNKILKDIVVKYMNLSGRHCPFIPVWDCHGLPIEITALKKIKEKPRPRDIRTLCRKTAKHWVKQQKIEFERLGVLARWEKPLMTLDPEYEAEEVRALAKLAKKNLLYQGKKPVYWCSALRTAVSASEAEYREHKSPSIYVKFPFKENLKCFKLPKNANCFFVIWTTTPWTLPANQALALHPDFEYGVFECHKEFLILAKDLKPAFEKNTGLTLKPISFFKGSLLENKKARHPFLEQDSLVILGSHVTKEEGTGIVHTAPGHGVEDFNIGLKYKLSAPVTVDLKGNFTEPAPDWLKEKNIFSNQHLITSKLKTLNRLIAEKQITHSYPYNPRSGKPLIFRATEQWFIPFDKKELSIRQKALKALKHSIKFYPDWGRSRLKAMVQNSPDWCLSRQRHWGVPLPVFYCKKCRAPYVNPEVIKEIADNMENSKEGIEYWFSRSAEELLPQKVFCKSCKGQVFEKGKDIVDVWFDSGVCHAVFKKNYGAGTFPADLYLEGSDQHRGWFQTSLNSSIALEEKSPFKTLVTHCFVNDSEGNKMSKSRGNVVHPEKTIQQRGAEILRLWTASEDYSQDLQAGEEIFNRVTESYRRFRNTLRFMLGNLNDFDPKKDLIPLNKMMVIDQWILSELAGLITNIKNFYETFQFHKIYQELNVFFISRLSALYLDLLKDRLYTFKKEGGHRRSAQSAVFFLLKNLLGAMSPITSFLCEEAYGFLPGEKKESIFLEDFPSPPKAWKNPALEKQMSRWLEWRTVAYVEMENLRKKGLIGSSLETEVHLFLPENSFKEFNNPEDISALKELFITSGLLLKASPDKTFKTKVKKAEGSKCLRCWHYTQQLNKEKICLKCISNLS